LIFREWGVKDFFFILRKISEPFTPTMVRQWRATPTLSILPWAPLKMGTPMHYQTEVLKTLANSKTYEDYIDNDQFQRDAFGFVVSAAALEKHKKTLAYGKNLPRFPTINPIRTQNVNILHAKMGIAGESGEIYDADTKEDVIKECGDLLWYMAVLLNEYGVDFPEVMEANIAKLRERYSTGEFTREEALARRDVTK
jgi:phosphoribosyl-ATP pyrophosphohydrolase